MTNEEKLIALIKGDIKSPRWRSIMRGWLAKCSSGPFNASTGDPTADPETLAVVTNPSFEVLAKCGPVSDARSCFDAVMFAAAANVLRDFLDHYDECDEPKETDGEHLVLMRSTSKHIPKSSYFQKY